MAQLAAWLVVCLALATLLRQRPVALVALAFALWTFIPAVVGVRFIGLNARTPFAFHPASWLILSCLAVQLLWNPKPLGQAIARHPYLTVVVSAFSLIALTTSLAEGSGGSRLLMDQIVCPYVMAVLLIAHAQKGERDGMRNTVLCLAAAQGALSLAQSAVGSTIFYSDAYATIQWFDPDRIDRWMGTTDSPLILSVLLCAAAALTLGLRSEALRVGLLVLYMASVLVTQSRVGAIVIGGVLVLAIFRSQVSLLTRILATISLAFTTWYLATSELAGGLLGRLQNDTGSNAARERAFGYALTHWDQYLASGTGLGSSYEFARNAGLESSLESSYLMYAIDVGIIVATVYFGAQIVILLKHGYRAHPVGMALASVLVIGLQHASSALAFVNLTGSLVWIMLGCLVANEMPGVVHPAPVEKSPNRLVRNSEGQALEGEAIGPGRRAVLW